MTSLTRPASPVQPARLPVDSRGVVRPDLIPVAAYLAIEGYWAPEYALDRLAAGQSPAELVRMGLLEPADELGVLALLRGIRPIRGGAPEPARDFDAAMERLEREQPVPAVLPETYREPAAWAAEDDEIERFNREHSVPAVLPYHSILS
jgi:hypothetical protein